MSGPMDKDTKDQLAGQVLIPLKGEQKGKAPRIRATPERFDVFIRQLKERIKYDRPE
jgi:hypothetical protein